jgi:hypothetical protein
MIVDCDSPTLMEMTQKAAEFDSLPVVPQPVLEGTVGGPAGMAGDGGGRVLGQYATCPRRRTARSSRPFANRVRSRNLPAAPKTIRAFIEDHVKAGKKPATIRRYVATVSRVAHSRRSPES